MNFTNMRVLVLAVIAAVVAVVAWIVFATGGANEVERMAPNTGAGNPGDDGVTSGALLAATPDAATVDDGTWSIGLDAPLRESVASDLGALVAARLDALLRVARADTGAALLEFSVAVIDQGGARREIAVDGAVHEADLADGGLWIIEAPGMCARWLAASALASHVEARATTAESSLLEVALAPAATVVVHVEATPQGREPLESIELTAELADDELFRQPRPHIDGRAPATHAERHAVFAGLRELLDPSLGRDRRRAILAALFAHPEFASLVDTQAPNFGGVLAPWCERVSERPSAAVTFENVPAVVAIEAVLASDDTLELTDFVRSDHVGHALLGRLRSALLPLAPGGTVEFGVVYAPFGRVIGRLPDDALLPANFTLVHRFQVQTDDGVAGRNASVRGPRIDERNFAWDSLPPGNYVINAEWRGPGRDQNFVEREFDVVAGETVDLGVLFAPVEGALTILPRFVNADGSPFVASLPAGRVVVSQGAISIRLGQWAVSPSIPLEFENGVPTVVRGLEPADYHVYGGEIVERDASAAPHSAATGFQSCEFLKHHSKAARLTLPATTFIELAIPVREIGRVRIEAVLDLPIEDTRLFSAHAFVAFAPDDIQIHGTSYPPVRRDGGATIVELNVPTMFGAWLGRVLVAVKSGPKTTMWFTASGEFVVEPRVESVVRWRLEPAASIRVVRSETSREPETTIELEQVAPNAQLRHPMTPTRDGERLVYPGLFPHTEYLVGGTQRVRTGGPGSVLDVP